MLKFFEAAACIVVIAAGSYYLYGEYSRSRAIAAANEAAIECSNALHRLRDGYARDDDPKKIGNCLVSGYISQNEFDAVVHPNR
jgi:hypothetical protein